MNDRERLTTTLGILLAGLLEAEQEAAAESEREPRLRHGSGVYPLGDSGVGAPEPPCGEPAQP